MRYPEDEVHFCEVCRTRLRPDARRVDAVGRITEVLSWHCPQEANHGLMAQLVDLTARIENLEAAKA